MLCTDFLKPVHIKKFELPIPFCLVHDIEGLNIVNVKKKQVICILD